MQWLGGDGDKDYYNTLAGEDDCKGSLRDTITKLVTHGFTHCATTYYLYSP
jgi:hypothetical protein